MLLFLYYFFTINTATLSPPNFLEDVNRLIVAHKYEEAGNFCRANRHLFVASVILRAVENVGKDHAVIMTMIENEGRRRADLIWNRIGYLLDLSNVAPMLGLLGTVLGMIEAFFTQSGPTGGIRSKALMGAIGGAMTATFFGLTVAIISVVFYTIIKSRTTKTQGEVEASVHAITDHMKRGAA